MPELEGPGRRGAPRPKAAADGLPVFARGSHTRRVHVVSHTHWDREWYMPFESFRARLVSLMDGLLHTLKVRRDFSSFMFDGQVSPIDDYLEVCPEREPEIREMVRDGRIVIGPWYTASDQFLVSGETTLRNLQWGIRRATELGGSMMIGYCPDQFGQMAQMPQVLRHAGIGRAVAARGVPASIEGQRFRWIGLDGSEVETLYLGRGYDTRQIIDSPELARQTIARQRAEAPREPVLLMDGGDHQLADAALPAKVRRFGGRISTLDRFWKEFGRDPSLPVLRGELRSPGRSNLTPGVVSNRVDIKLATARAERELERYAEPLAAFALADYPQRRLDMAWKHLIHNAAHDSITATGVDATSYDVLGRAQNAFAIAEGITRQGREALGVRMKDGGMYVWNPSSFTRTFHLPVGRGSDVWRALDVPPLGWAPLELRHIENPRFSAAHEPPHPEVRFVDEPDLGDTYNFGHDSRVTPAAVEIPTTVEQLPGEPFTRMTMRWENRTKDHRLRMHIPLPQKADTCTADTAFGAVTRPAVPEAVQGSDRLVGYPAGKFIVAGGLAVFVDRTAEFEIDTDRNELVITLLRAHGAVSRTAVEGRDSAPGPVHPTFDTQLQQPMQWEVAVMPWSGTETLPWKEWEQFALPGALFSAPGGGDLPARGTAYPSLPDGVLSAVLPGEVRTFDGAAPWKIHSEPLRPEFPTRHTPTY